MATTFRAFEQLRQFVSQTIVPHRHTVLLIAVVTAFSVRPLLGDSQITLVVFSVSLVALLLIALYIVQIDELIGEREVLLAKKKRRLKIGWLLAVPAIAERISIALVPSRWLIVTGMVCWLVLLAYVTWNELRAVLKQKAVTTETISMSISIYLLIGLTWSLLYILLYYVQAHAFAFEIPLKVTAAGRGSEFAVFVYFSLTTISTIGYGDITPLTLQARYAAVAEGITGQFYLAILVARLVGLYMVETSRTGSRQPAVGLQKLET